MPVAIRYIGVDKTAFPSRTVRTMAEAMLDLLGLSTVELSIVLCDDPTIRTLNRGYRGFDKSTDVLAFPLWSKDHSLELELLGDVVISLDTAGRQAAQKRWDVRSEVAFLLAHGLLHLVGFDHNTKDEFRRMSAMTDVLFSSVF